MTGSTGFWANDSVIKLTINSPPLQILCDRIVSNYGHVHMHLRFMCRYYLRVLQARVHKMFKWNVDMQAVQSEHNVLRYVLQSDDKVYFSCSVSKLSFAYWMRLWASKIDRLCFNDSFVLENSNIGWGGGRLCYYLTRAVFLSGFRKKCTDM
jgi:hypothetical protein